MRKTLLVAAGFVALRENGDNDGCGYYYDGKDCLLYTSDAADD